MLNRKAILRAFIERIDPVTRSNKLYAHPRRVDCEQKSRILITDKTTLIGLNLIVELFD